MQNESEDHSEEDIEYVSKSQLKREMLALQELAIELTQLKAAHLAELPLTPKLSEAIRETHNIKKREALRRHRQYLGRVMRDADHEAIAEALAEIKGRADRLARLQPLVEQWRDKLIHGDNDTLSEFIETFPDTDRQRLRQLASNAKKEYDKLPEDNKSGPSLNKKAANRKLLDLVKESIRATQ